MDREAVTSTTIASVGHDSDTGMLEVEFVTGSIYRYRRVSEDVFEAFLTAASKGGYFNAHIKDAYDCERVK
jgi:hypothetical protein